MGDNKKSLPKQTDEKNTVVIYNRVPKTGSTSFVGVVYDLCKKNRYHALHINISNNMHTLTPRNQVQLIIKILFWNNEEHLSKLLSCFFSDSICSKYNKMELYETCILPWTHGFFELPQVSVKLYLK